MLGTLAPSISDSATMPSLQDTALNAALSGRNILAAAWFWNAAPYQGKFVSHRNPRRWSMAAATVPVSQCAWG